MTTHVVYDEDLVKDQDSWMNLSYFPPLDWRWTDGEGWRQRDTQMEDMLMEKS